MEARNERLAEEEKARAKKKAEALARMKAQKEAEKNMSPEELAATRQKAIEEAKAKARERKAALMVAKTHQLVHQQLQLKTQKKPKLYRELKMLKEKP